jgi:hypothetical protein
MKLKTLTSETITDAQIEALQCLLPQSHYAWQSTVDALTPSGSHPNRQRNAKRLCAIIYNELMVGGDS